MIVNAPAAVLRYTRLSMAVVKYMVPSAATTTSRTLSTCVIVDRPPVGVDVGAVREVFTAVNATPLAGAVAVWVNVTGLPGSSVPARSKARARQRYAPGTRPLRPSVDAVPMADVAAVGGSTYAPSSSDSKKIGTEPMGVAPLRRRTVIGA